MSSSRYCEGCHAPFWPDAPEGLCASCLLKFALEGDFAAPAPAGVAPSAGGREPEAGFVFGDFEVHTEIARGGMGVVYRARQISLNRPVALKVILVGRWASEAQIERFQTEAEAAARLNHPNIVPVHEVGEVGGQHYLSMPLIDGGNLAARLEELRAEPTNRRSVAIVAKVARAVHYAHQRRILHRDLKPTNILLDGSGEPHLTDFGLAKVIENDSSFTRTVAILGTPGYMAPEQAAGRARNADARADVYSIGAILYELLTGRPPFAAPTPLETLELVRDAEPVWPSRLDPRVDRDLAIICLKCLRKEPSGRYASAEALAEDLERWLEGRPILARRATPIERLWLWSQRQPAAATAVALLLLLAAGLLFAAQHLRHQRDQTRRHLWHSYLAQAASTRATAEAGRRQRALEVVERAAEILPSLEVRNEAITVLALTDLAVRRRWAGFPAGSVTLAVEARQRHYARADASGRISVREIEGDRELAALEGPGGGCDWLRFSPDGRHLAARFVLTNAPPELRLWDWQTFRVLVKLRLPAVAGVPVEFAPDSQSVFAGDSGGTVRQLSLPAGQVLSSHPLGSPAAQFACSPDSQWLAVAFNNEIISAGQLNATVQVLGLKSNEQATFVYPANVRSLAWHPNSAMLAVGCNDYRIYEEEVASRKRQKTYERQENPVMSCAYNFDGTLLASCGYDGTVILWNAIEGRRIVSTRVRQASLSFAPASARLAFGLTPPEITLWEAAPPTVFLEMPQTRTYCSSASFSPDGRWIVLANPFGGLLVVDLEERRNALWHTVTGIRSAWFDAEGRHLVTSGHAGLQRWPFNVRTNDTRAPVQLGAAERLEAPSQKPFEYAASSANGQNLAVGVGFDDLLLGEFGPTTNWHELGIRGVMSLSFSRDGRWLATVPGRTASLCVWDLSTKTPVFSEAASATAVHFSPDNRWLVAAVDREYRIWQAGSWTRHRVIQGEGVEGVHHPADFSPDGRLLAVVRRLQAVQLIHPESGEELATLQAPDPSTIQCVKFSPDSRRLIVVTRTRGLHVWELPALRAELTRMGLDWKDQSGRRVAAAPLTAR